MQVFEKSTTTMIAGKHLIGSAEQVAPNAGFGPICKASPPAKQSNNMIRYDGSLEDYELFFNWLKWRASRPELPCDSGSQRQYFDYQQTLYGKRIMAKTPEQKRDAAKDARLRKFFRTSLEEYRAIEKFQWNNGFGTLLGTSRRGLDHNHTTGFIRGVLDWRINKALGIIENSFKGLTADILRELACYVECPPAIQVIGHRYGLIGLARNKKVMIYGSPEGPLPAIKGTAKKRKKKNAR